MLPRSWFALVVAACLALPGCGGDGASAPSDRRLRLATTTSTANSGLLDELIPPFEKAHRCTVQVLAVGTGQALKLGERGDADLLLVHARSRELAFVQAGHGVERRDVMYNDFVIAGPASDPAGLKGLPITDAFAKLAKSDARFVSRGDDSGTHIRELALWKAAGFERAPESRAEYLSAGQGMGGCLVMADEKGAYVLTDRGTYLAFRPKLDLVVLVEGDASLRNPYGAILVNPERHSHVEAGLGRAFLDYLTSADGRARISGFRVDGQRLFHPHDKP